MSFRATVPNPIRILSLACSQVISQRGKVPKRALGAAETSYRTKITSVLLFLSTNPSAGVQLSSDVDLGTGSDAAFLKIQDQGLG